MESKSPRMQKCGNSFEYPMIYYLIQSVIYLYRFNVGNLMVTGLNLSVENIIYSEQNFILQCLLFYIFVL